MLCEDVAAALLHLGLVRDLGGVEVPLQEEVREPAAEERDDGLVGLAHHQLNELLDHLLRFAPQLAEARPALRL